MNEKAKAWEEGVIQATMWLALYFQDGDKARALVDRFIQEKNPYQSTPSSIDTTRANREALESTKAIFSRDLRGAITRKESNEGGAAQA